MSRRLVAHTLFVVLAVAGAGSPGRVRNQETIELQRSSDGGAGSAPTMEREAFTYVVAGRRDPFRPVSAPAVATGFFGVRLLGIISHDDPRRSVAVVRLLEEEDQSASGDGSAPGSNAGENHRVSIGDRIGNIRVLVIDRKHVVVALDGPAGTSRRILELDNEARSDSR